MDRKLILSQWQCIDEPEACAANGLTLMYRGTEEDLSYEFNDILIFKDADGKHYGVTDCGCSCPVPFEEVKNLSDMTLLGSAEAAEEFYTQWAAPHQSQFEIVQNLNHIKALFQ